MLLHSRGTWTASRAHLANGFLFRNTRNVSVGVIRMTGTPFAKQMWDGSLYKTSLRYLLRWPFSALALLTFGVQRVLPHAL